MKKYRIEQHPILPVRKRPEVTFTWQGQALTALKGETMAAALFANGIHTFGKHHKDGSPQGIFCANGQCAQCMVLADGLPVKACMELVTPGLRLEPVNGLPELPKVGKPSVFSELVQLNVPVLIIGGGPAGLSAAIQLAKVGIRSLIVDDKHRLGGKLVLQTHRFFGSHEDVFAGTRGINIASRLEAEARSYPEVEVWLHSTALAVFSDKKVGILKDGTQYALVKPQVLLVAPPPTCVAGTAWHKGWIVFVNLDRDAPAARDSGEELLHVYPAWDTGQIEANRTTLSFRAFGQSGVTATVTFCDDRGSGAARAVIISQTGRPRVSDRASSGSALVCS